MLQTGNFYFQQTPAKLPYWRIATQCAHCKCLLLTCGIISCLFFSLSCEINISRFRFEKESSENSQSGKSIFKNHFPNYIAQTNVKSEKNNDNEENPENNYKIYGWENKEGSNKPILLATLISDTLAEKCESTIFILLSASSTVVLYLLYLIECCHYYNLQQLYHVITRTEALELLGIIRQSQPYIIWRATCMFFMTTK